MIGIILLITLLIGLLALVVVLIYSRQSEVELTDRSVDLGDVLPIQTITEDAIINGNGDITVGYRLYNRSSAGVPQFRQEASSTGLPAVRGCRAHHSPTG